MLAARGVSLGIGKDMKGLSNLNELSAADKALLGKLDKRRRASERTKYVVKKHVDSKTLLTACITVIIGTSVIVFGLIATIAGYFDDEIGRKLIFTSGDESESGLNDPNITGANRIIWTFLKSLQYVGPIVMGFGMFSLIMACVVTLESRDKHSQIVEMSLDKNLAKRRSTRGSSTQRPKIVDQNANYSRTENKSSEDLQRLEDEKALLSNGIPTNQNCKKEFPILVTKEVSVQNYLADPVIYSISSDFSDNPPSTDMMAEYTFPCVSRPRKLKNIEENKEINKFDNIKEEPPADKDETAVRETKISPKELCAEYASKTESPIGKKAKKVQPLMAINRSIPKDRPAPLVSADSIDVEQSTM